MTRTRRLAAWPCAALTALALATASCGGSAAPAPQTAPLTQPALFYDEATFFSSVREAASMPPPDGRVAGGVIPHDWLGGRYITWLFQGLAAGEAPETVILIGPNHDNEGRPGALTSALAWSTPFGVVEPDAARIDALIAQGIVTVDEPVLTTEHSVAGIMPAIAYYLPGTRVVPVILRGDTSPAETSRIAAALAAQLGDDAVLVAAVDFSHDLVQRAAERNNAVTLDALQRGDSATLFTLNNQFLDSPESIAVLMEAMSQAGAGAFVLTADTNSAALRGDELAPTTSYLVGYYPSDGGLTAGERGPR
jgi:AmmeMemoRadiSam system protein B